MSGRGAVFSASPEPGAAEQLMIVQEVDRHRVGEAELNEFVDAIQAAITEHHGIQANSVILVEPMRIPTTSSGKIQRGQCRQQFVDRDLETLAEWHAPSSPDDRAAGIRRVQKAVLAQAILAEAVRRAAHQA